MSDWLSKLRNAKKSCITQQNFKKVYYELEKNVEMVEVYNMDTGVLTRRAWRNKSKLRDADWEVEVGDEEPIKLKSEAVIKENSNQPIVTKRITKNIIEWRIRNLSYSIETYSVTADAENICLVVRTTNKKYFKKLKIPELERVNLQPQQSAIQYTHKYNTLIITYKKPKKVLDMENVIFEEIKTLKSSEDPNCKVS